MSNKPIIGITMGDAAGVGPEIIVMALLHGRVQNICKPVVIGDTGTIKEALQITNRTAKVRKIRKVGQAYFKEELIEVIDLDNLDSQLIEKGKISSLAGKAAFEYLQSAVRMALVKDIEAIITAPLNKEALNKAGYHYPGHTEILAELCGVSDVCMMLVVDNLRVAHVSWHISLRKACDFLNKERILTTLKLSVEAVQKMGIRKPHVAVAGLNPHAGENGLLGKEEIMYIIPAIKEALFKGIDVVGPIPPDTLFYRAKQREFDLVIAMYHDQGHIPLKMLGFFEGVNVTLGLPIIRTSVAHGTAFDRAGKGTASPESLIKAIELAVRLVRGRFS